MTLTAHIAAQNIRAEQSSKDIADAMKAGLTLDQAVKVKREERTAEVAEAIAQGEFELVPAYKTDRYAYDIVAGHDRIVVAVVQNSHKGLYARHVDDVPYGTLDGYPVVGEVLPDVDAGAKIATLLGLAQ